MDRTDRMMRLFAGYRGAHGTHGTPTSSRGVKQEIKKSAATVREPVTRELWQKHLDGERPLGVIPITEENTCNWGCIDVDVYDLDFQLVIKKLRDLPLVPCKTKSGGLHAFLFVSEPVPAEEMRSTLQTLAASLGWGECEIFPKQTQVLSQRGDLGNWLNMPYLAGDKTERYGLKPNGLAMSLSEFLRHAEGKAVADIRSVSVGLTEDLSDGPPCLQHLTASGFPEGTRNNGLFALGIYTKKKFGENWRVHLEDMNQKYMDPPLGSDEVVTVQKSLEKKDYNYSCKEVPLCNFCESSLCKTRKFGVGTAGQYPEISGLSKLETDPPIWFLDIEGHRVELETGELQEYRKFQKACMDQITVFFMPVKADTWASMVGSAMENAVIIEAPREMGVYGHFMELLESFCKDRHRGQRWQDIFDGRPFFEEETSQHWFRLGDFTPFLEREGFRVWGRNKIGKELKQVGGQKGKNIEGRYVNLFYVSDEIFGQTVPPSPPSMSEEPI